MGSPVPVARQRLGIAVLALIVVLGAVARLRQYLHDRSLWYDELFLARNIQVRSMFGLTRPLIFEQAAPLGFLWSAKASIDAFGQSELAFRLLPLLAGIGTVAFVALVARRLFTFPAAFAATGMVALADQSIHYSSEFKQYTTEAAVAAVLLLVGSHCLGHTLSDEPRRPLLLAVAGALALVCSISAIFVLAGIGVVLVIQVVQSRRRRCFLTAACVALTWAASAGAMYVVSWRSDARNKSLHDYWKGLYGPTPWVHPGWYVSAWTALINAQVAISWSWAALALTVLGAMWLARRAPAIALVALVTVVSTALASWAGIYPFGGRLLLFLVPTICIIFGAAVDAAATLLSGSHPRTGYLVACACAALLVCGSFGTAWASAQHPYESEEMRQLLEAVRPRFRTGDRLFVAGEAALSFSFYRDRTGFADVPFVPQKLDPTLAPIPAFLRQVNRLGPGVTWILYSRLHPDDNRPSPGQTAYNEANYFDAHFHGRVVRIIRRTGVMAVEVEQPG